MKVDEIRNMSADEQVQKLQSLKEELFNLRFQHVVAIEELIQHKLYKKSVKRTVKFKAHDENQDAHIGDRVQIMETRPLSKEKRWRLVKILEKAK